MRRAARAAVAIVNRAFVPAWRASRSRVLREITGEDSMKQSQLIERLVRIRGRRLTLIAQDEIDELIHEIRTTGVQADIAEMPRDARAVRS